MRDLNRPNGLAFSPDFKVLYVNNSDAAKNLVMRYDVAADGTLSGGRVFADPTSKTDGLADGLKVDSRGQRLHHRPRRRLGPLAGRQAPRHDQAAGVPANCGWGDDGKTLYMTAVTGIYRVKTLVGK